MIKDMQGRKWFMRFKHYRQGWSWDARHSNHGQSSGVRFFQTKELAAADARRQILGHDAVAASAEYLRRLSMRGSDCALTAEDCEAIERARSGRS